MTDADSLIGAPRPVDKLLQDIDAAIAATGRARHPQRIRAGAIGMPCKRALLYDFLWAAPPEVAGGKLMRIFETGNIEEERLIADLKRAGWEIMDRDPVDPKKQISVSFLDGHGFGYVDGQGRDRKVSSPWLIIECKSHNEKSFKKLIKEGVAASKPEHHGQIQTYMRERDIPLGLYIAKNKNTDEIHIEYVRHDEVYTSRLLESAGMIVSKSVMPPKIGRKPDHPNCMFCRKKEVCHNGVVPLRNCRTCEHSRALPGGIWGCQLHKCLLTKELAPHGCADGYQLAEIFK